MTILLTTPTGVLQYKDIETIAELQVDEKQTIYILESYNPKVPAVEVDKKNVLLMQVI